MHYLPINQVKTGMILGRDMYDFTDKILLHRGKALTEHLILRLQDYGYQGVYIDDELTKDLEIEEIISMELRTKALAAIEKLMWTACGISQRRSWTVSYSPGQCHWI